MLKDITIGQYVFGESPIHKLDPRTKIIITFLYMLFLFVADKFILLGILGIFLLFTIKLSGINSKFIIKSVKPIIFLLAFTMILNILFMNDGQVIYRFGFFIITNGGAYFAVITGLRLVLLVIGCSMLTYTTAPIELTDGIEKLMEPLNKFSVPVHEIAMMMSIALRFIPTLIDETDKIIKAQKSRGAQIDTGNLMNRIKSTIPVLVPLFINSFRRADELAIAMESRCYRGGKGRTKLKQLKCTNKDYYAYIMSAVFFAVVIIVKIIIPQYTGKWW